MGSVAILSATGVRDADQQSLSIRSPLPPPHQLQSEVVGDLVGRLKAEVFPLHEAREHLLRILDSQDLAVNMGQLGFQLSSLKTFREAIHAAYGMILVTGPTGSGKSTTLYSAVREILSPTANFVTSLPISMTSPTAELPG